MRLVRPESRFIIHWREHEEDVLAQNDRYARASNRRAQLAQTFQALATSRRLPLYLALLTATLVVPSLAIGLQLDDYMLRFCTLQSAGSDALCPSVLAPFTIATGRSDVMHRAIEYGMAPFWAWSGLLIHFMRPLSGLSHWIDFHLFPNSPALMHAENVAWLAGAIFLATRLYRATMGVGTASAGAALALAVDHVHGVPVGWIANRNAVMAACFATAALVMHERSTRRPSVWTTLAGVGCLLLAFLSGEIALGAWAFLLAHAFVLDRRPVRERALGLLPYAALTVVWRVVYSATGHGAVGSDFYIDPVREPMAFIRVLPTRLPLLLQGTFGFPPAESAFYVKPHLAPVVVAFAAVFSVLLVVAFGRLVRHHEVARYFAIGCGLSVLASCTMVAHNRLLYFPSLGGMGLLALAIEAFARNDLRLVPTGIARRVSRLVVTLSGGLHVFVSPLLLPLAACTVALAHNVADRAIPSAIATMTDVRHENLIVVSAPEFYAVEYLRLVQRALNRPEPEKVRFLSVGDSSIRARRVDAHTLELTYEGWQERKRPLCLYRTAEHPMKAGDTVALDGLEIVVTRVTADGRPAVATFRFTESLDSPKLRWVIWQKDQYVPFTPPHKDGEAVEIGDRSAEVVFC